MIALIQRVKYASVSIDNEMISEIENGLLILLGVEKGDSEEKASRLSDKVLNYRIFGDDQDKMNLSVKQINGSVLVVSQFTLAADTQKGSRPSFTKGATTAEAQQLYNYFTDRCKQHIHTETGVFAANMQVSLLNDGPVTFWLHV